MHWLNAHTSLYCCHIMLPSRNCLWVIRFPLSVASNTVKGVLFTAYWITCTEFNSNVLSWVLLHYVVHVYWLMLYHKCNVYIIMQFTCLFSWLITLYVWLSFSVSISLFVSRVVSIVDAQSCSSSHLLVAWQQHFYKSSPLACNLSCFGVSQFCIVP